MADFTHEQMVILVAIIASFTVCFCATMYVVAKLFAKPDVIINREEEKNAKR